MFHNTDTSIPGTCLFPTCSRHAEKNGYCIGHRIYANSTEVKTPKPIAKQSDKRKEDNKELRKRYALFLAKPENKRCKMQMDEGCTVIATIVHHTAGREGDQLFNEADWMPGCAHCNLMAEVNDAEARDKGVKKSKHQLRESSSVLAEHDEEVNATIVSQI